MIPIASIVQAAAMECVGTPWRYQGRVPDVALDCVGLVEHCRLALGWRPLELPRYPWPPASQLLLSRLDQHLVRVQRDPQPGDVCAFWERNPGRVRHVGVVVQSREEPTVIMASPQFGEVRGEPLRGAWSSRLHGVWEFPAP